MKILVCFGTRPEAIKMAPVIYALRIANIDHQVCVTAQHRSMLDQVLSFFEIEPDYDLDLMMPGQSLNELSARIITAIDGVLESSQPDMVLVQGDTTTAAMTALAAFHRGVDVGHIEAGLRTHNLGSPFPEEMNRQITARMSQLHFAPTKRAQANLLNEGIVASKITVTGNTVIDALLWSMDKLSQDFNNEAIASLRDIRDPSKKIILVTAHRRENFGSGIKELCDALFTLAQRGDCQIIWPVHPNPEVQRALTDEVKNAQGISLIEPLDYPAFVWLMSQSQLIISDSGGIQEEAPTLHIPVLVTRDTTERQEAVDARTSILVGMNKSRIIEESVKLLDGLSHVLVQINPFGDGKAAEKIASEILKYQHRPK